MIRADLHLHSCLSPCSTLDMSPLSIVRLSLEKGLQALALTDHNSCRNSPAMAKVCAAAGVPCLHGMEACTVEEIHVLCLFDALAPALELSDYIHARLPDIPCIRKLGEQVVVNEKDEVEEWEERYLGSGADVTLTDLCRRVLDAGGLFIPSHVDRPAHSLLSQLGRVPDLPYSALEISPWYNRETDPLKVVGKYPLIGNSDSHMLSQLGTRWTEYEGETLAVNHFQPLRIQTGS